MAQNASPFLLQFFFSLFKPSVKTFVCILSLLTVFLDCEICFEFSLGFSFHLFCLLYSCIFCVLLQFTNLLQRSHSEFLVKYLLSSFVSFSCYSEFILWSCFQGELLFFCLCIGLLYLKRQTGNPIFTSISQVTGL